MTNIIHTFLRHKTTEAFIFSRFNLNLQRLVTNEEQETAGSLMAAALGIGLALGGALSSALVHVL